MTLFDQFLTLIAFVTSTGLQIRRIESSVWICVSSVFPLCFLCVSSVFPLCFLCVSSVSSVCHNISYVKSRVFKKENFRNVWILIRFCIPVCCDFVLENFLFCFVDWKNIFSFVSLYERLKILIKKILINRGKTNVQLRRSVWCLVGLF